MAILPQLRWFLGIGTLLGVLFLYSDQVREIVYTSALEPTTPNVANRISEINAKAQSQGDPSASLPSLTNSTQISTTTRDGSSHSESMNSSIESSSQNSDPDNDGGVTGDTAASDTKGTEAVPSPESEEVDTSSASVDGKSSSIDKSDGEDVIDVNGDGDMEAVKLDFLPGFQPHRNVYIETFQPRGQSIEEQARQALTKKWGAWTFVDPSSDSRPRKDYYARYPSRDIPGGSFPSSAWQTDRTYLDEFLPQAQDLVKRAMEAILTEYGHGVDHEPSKSFEERADTFYVELTDDCSAAQLSKKDSIDAGGYMNNKGWQGLQRRILHAIMTEDTFRVVMAGHSATAGHGNIFQQSFALQVQRVLEPIFARLGVTMTAHNIGMGGLGTVQNALGATDLYSDDVDVMVYDSGMTEPEPYNMDVFMRQVILGGKKVPFLWVNQDNGRFFKADIFKYLAEECDADVGVYGLALRGIPELKTYDDVNKTAWAARYLKCDTDMGGECRQKWYMNRCWIERDDVTPPVGQSRVVGGQAGWHPGNRFHQLQGRMFAFIILTALDKALERWRQSEDNVLLDAEWHVNDYYDNIRTKLRNLNATTPCHSTDRFPSRVCKIPLKGRSEFTPRLNPFATSIRSMVKAGNITDLVEPNIYDPPDMRIPELDAGDVDIVNILENGVPFTPLMGRRRRILERFRHEETMRSKDSSTSINPLIQPGLGWSLQAKTAPDNCDGSYDSFCGRSTNEPCLLNGHNDFRGGLVFDSLSGWLVLNLKQVQQGLIILKLEDWHYDPNPQTEGWTCENNECARRLRGSGSEEIQPFELQSAQIGHRRLAPKPAVPEYCEDFQFEFAIDGKITTWNLGEWRKREQKPARVVQLWTLLDDPNFISDNIPKDVELAIRMQGCGRTKIFKLTHVYWA